MSKTSLKQQVLNFSSLFKQLFSDYYRVQKKNFWIIQALISLSTILGLFWILSLYLGLSNLQNPTIQQAGIKSLLFSWLYQLPLWQWLLLASVAGIISAYCLYQSFQLGVKSVLVFQKQLNLRCLSKVSDSTNSYWPTLFEYGPKPSLLRILKLGVQLCGLVARRMARATVSLFTFFIAFVALLYIDFKLLMILLPLALLYIIGLYFINRYASRVSLQMNDNMPIHNLKFNELVSRILNKQLKLEDLGFEDEFQQSLHLQQAELKYNRRLAEIHVTWLNTLFLVFGMAFIIIYMIYIQKLAKVDWQNLILFLITLKYAVSSLQEIASTTVAFSRFLPEIDRVYRLLNFSNNNVQIKKHSITSPALLFCNSNQFSSFEQHQLLERCQFEPNSRLTSLKEIRNSGMMSFLDSLDDSENDSSNCIIVESNLNHLKQFIQAHLKVLEKHYSNVNVVVLNEQNSDSVKLHDFKHYEIEDYSFEDNDLIDS